MHIETAADVAVASDAGADAIAHLPHNFGRYPNEALRIGDELAATLAANGTAVITTNTLGAMRIDAAAQGDPGFDAEAAREVWRGNLKRLKDAAVTLLVGSDLNTPFGEVGSWRDDGTFADAELLRAWAVTTPRWMFPGRPIGSLSAGNEASVIGVTASPLEDWDTLGDVRLTIKEGLSIPLAAPTTRPK